MKPLQHPQDLPTLLEGIRQELARPSSPHRQLRQVVAWSAAFFQASQARLLLLGGDGKPLDSVVYGEDRSLPLPEREALAALDQEVGAYVMTRSEAVLVPDTAQDARWTGRTPVPGCLLCVPCGRKAGSGGYWSLFHPQPGAFGDEHRAQLEAIADLIAGAPPATVRSPSPAPARETLEGRLVGELATLRTRLGAATVLLAIRRKSRGLMVEYAAGRDVRKWQHQVLDLPGLEEGLQQEPESFTLPSSPALPGPLRVAAVPGYGALLAFPGRRTNAAPDLSDPMKASGLQLAVLIDRAVQRLQRADQRALLQGVLEGSAAPLLVSTPSGQVLFANLPALRRLGMSAGEQNEFTLPAAGLDLSRPGGQSVLLQRPGPGRTEQVRARVTPLEVPGPARLLWALEGDPDWAAMVYHDLQSPLTNISNSLLLLGGAPEISGNAGRAELVDIAARSAKRLTGLVRSLLDLAHLSAGQLPLRLEQADLAALLQEVQADTTPQLREKGQRLRLDPASPPSWRLDPDLVRRVLVNLVENASRYSPPDTTISVAAAAEQDGLHLRVSDQGPGIPEPDREKVFLAYVTGVSGRGRAGIGLAFCRAAVAAHGGRIWVDAGPEGGSVFHIRLPGAGAPGDPPRAGAGAGRRSASRRSSRPAGSAP